MGKFTGVTRWRILNKKLRSLAFIPQASVSNSSKKRNERLYRRGLQSKEQEVRGDAEEAM